VHLAPAGGDLEEGRVDQPEAVVEAAIGAHERARPARPPPAPRAALVPASAVGTLRRPCMIRSPQGTRPPSSYLRHTLPEKGNLRRSRIRKTAGRVAFRAAGGVPWGSSLPR
jgi:hypothetical protein